MTAYQYGRGGRGTVRQDPQLYSQVQDEGVALPQEIALNFVGGGVTAADDAANNRTNVTVPLGAGLNPPANPGENNMVCWGLNGNLSYGPQVFTDGTYLGVGAAGTLAAAGNIRLPSGGAVNFRNNTGLLDARGIALDNATNNLMVGDAGSSNIDYTTSTNHRFFVGAAQVAEISSIYIEVGSASNPAVSGEWRSPNATYMRFRNAANTADVTALGVDAANTVILGGANAAAVNIDVAGANVAIFDTTYMSLGANPAQAGIFRLPNNGEIYGRNVGNTGNIFLASVSVADTVVIGGSSSINTLLRLNSGGASLGNLAVGALPANWQAGRQIIFIGDAVAAPTGDPAAGGFMYSIGGAAYWRGSGSTTTCFGPSEPHCKRCGKDWVLEAFNDKARWHYSICLHCMVKALTKAGIPQSEYMMFDRVA